MPAPQGLYVQVLVPLPLDQPEYTYILDLEHSVDPTKLIGKFCFIPLGKGKTYTGVITKIPETPPAPNIKYKRILALLPYPALPPTTLKLWRWVAEYYMCSLGEVYRAAVPGPFRPDGEQRYRISEEVPDLGEALQAFVEEHSTFSLKELRREFPDEYSYLLQKLIELDAIIATNEPRIYRKKEVIGWTLSPFFLASQNEQSRVLELLKRSRQTKEAAERIIAQKKAVDTSPVTLSELGQRLGLSNYALNKLRDLGVIVEQRKSTPQYVQAGNNTPCDTAPDFGDKSILLHHLPFSPIEERLHILHLKKAVESDHGQYLLLLPSQECLEYVEEKLQQILGAQYRPYHSGCTLGERHHTWHDALKGTPGVYVGLRAAVWLPIPRLKEIVVVDEEDIGYRQYEPTPRFTASSVALMMAMYCRAKTILTSASPSVQSMLLAIQGRYNLLETPAKHPKMPTVTAVDMNKAFEQNKVQARMLSFEMSRAITTTLHEKRPILLMYQRKGFAKYVECTACHCVPTCPKCHTAYRYYSGSRNLVCPVCGHYETLPDRCPNCNQHTLQAVGTGVERLAMALRQLYPGVSVGLWDGQNKPNTQITICTLYTPPLELLHRAGMIGVIQLDLLVMRPDFRANEYTYRYLMTCLTEARNAKHLLVQYFVQRPNALDAIMQHDYKLLLDHELHERHLVKFPPFSRQLDLVLQSDNRQAVFELSQTLTQQIGLQLPTLSILGPTPLPSYKKDTDIGYRITLLIPLQENLSNLRALLHKWRKEILTQHRGSSLYIHFDMDPL